MEWQPIATAPKKTPVLINVKSIWGESGIFVAQTADQFGWFVCGVGGYEWENEFEDHEITHWMPLPEPPKE